MVQDFSLNLGGQNIFFKARRSDKAKRLRLVFNVDGFEVVIPKYFIGSVKSFILKNEKWVIKQSSKHQKKVLKPFNEELMFLGHKYETKIKYRSKGFRISLDKKNNIFLIETPNVNLGFVKKKLINFLRRKSRILFHNLLKKWNTEYIKLGTVSVKDQKTRWGSASNKGNLNFNYRLIMAPVIVVEYIVIHELCHLREHNHSKKYWSLVKEKMSDYKVQDKWLKKNGDLLKII